MRNLLSRITFAIRMGSTTIISLVVSGAIGVLIGSTVGWPLTDLDAILPILFVAATVIVLGVLAACLNSAVGVSEDELRLRMQAAAFLRQSARIREKGVGDEFEVEDILMATRAYRRRVDGEWAEAEHNLRQAKRIHRLWSRHRDAITEFEVQLAHKS